MGFEKLLSAAIALVFLCSFAAASSNTAYVKINFAEARADSGDWSHHAKAVDGQSIDARASIYLDKGYEPYYEVKAVAEVFGYNGSSWTKVKNVPGEYDYVYPHGYEHDTYVQMQSFGWRERITGYYSPWGIREYGYGFPYYASWTTNELSTKYFTFENAFTADNEFEQYRIDITVSIVGSNSSDSESAYVQVLGIPEDMPEEENYEEYEAPETETIYTDYYSNFAEPEASCYDLRLSTADFSLEENSVQEKTFTVYNSGNSKFFIDSFSVRENNSRFEVEKLSHASYVSPYGTANLRVKVYSGDIEGQLQGLAYASLEGHFEEGSNCSKTNRPFFVNIEDSFEFEEGARIVKTDSFTPLENSNYSGAQTGTQTAYFASDEPSCSGLSLYGSNVSLYADETVYASFYLRNNSSELFFVDWIYAYDLSDEIMVDEHSRERTIEPGASGEIVVKISALETPVDPTAFLKARGHFSSGKNCYEHTLEKSFSVTVLPTQRDWKNSGEEEENNEAVKSIDLSKFSIVVPQSKELENNRGLVVFHIRNFSGERANIAIDGTNAEVQPRVISVPNGTDDEFFVTVEASGNSEIVFSPKIGNYAFGSKMVLIKSKQAVGKEEAAEDKGEDTASANGSPGFDLGTALFSLGTGLWIALIVLAVLVLALFIFVNRDQPEEPWAEANGKEDWAEYPFRQA